MQNISELRAYLANQLSMVAKKEMSPAHANAAANLAGKVLSTVKMEMDYCRLVGAKARIDFLGVAKSTSDTLTIEHQPDEEIDVQTGEVKSKKKVKDVE